MKELTKSRAELLLALVIVARSTSFVMNKVGVERLGAFHLLAFRFLIAFFILLPFGYRRLVGISKRTLLRGMLLGAAFFLVMAAEVTGLKTAQASTAAFLENTAIVLVPLFEAMLKRRLPSLSSSVGAGLSLCGVALLTIKPGGDFSLSQGEWLLLLAAALYAGAIILTDRISRAEDPLTLGILQVGFMGAFGLCAAVLFEAPRVPNTPGEWGIVLTLAIVCSVFGFTLQPLAQSRTSAERAGLFCAFSPLCASLMGWLCLEERLGASGVGGAACILLGILLAQVLENRTIKKEAAI